jgi:class 3 adenylate cyclase
MTVTVPRSRTPKSPAPRPSRIPQATRIEIYAAFAQVTQAICGQNVDLTSPDADLLDRICDCLSILGDAALFAGFLQEGIVLRLKTPRAPFTEGQLQQVGAAVRIMAESDEGWRDRFHFVVDGIDVLGSLIREKVVKQVDGKEVGELRLRGYSALCFGNLAHDDTREFFISLHSWSTAALLHQTLQRHATLFLPFPPEMSERYWFETITHPEKRLGIPWRQDRVSTITLAYDLRKSTFCMENAARLDLFATWLDQLVQILMGLGHRFGGVFDKFTGDGGLVHFVRDYSRLDDAVEAAIAMQDATLRHLEKLRKFLFLNSRKLGAGIGIGVADTRWSLDHRNNPIVVGRGVVHACRLMSDAPPGAIRVTNLAYQELSPAFQKLFREIAFVSKDHPASNEVTAWELLLTDQPDVASRNVSIVDEVCNSVYGKVPVSHGPAGR